MSARVVTPFGDFLADLGETRRGGGGERREEGTEKEKEKREWRRKREMMGMEAKERMERE